MNSFMKLAHSLRNNRIDRFVRIAVIQPALNQSPLPQKESKAKAPGNPLRAAEGWYSGWYSVNDIVSQPPPVGFSIPEPLSLSSQIFRRSTGATAIELSDSSSLLERINVWESHTGSLI